MTFWVPPMEPNTRLCFIAAGGVADSHSPDATWGDCHVARNDTDHHPDYFPAGRLQRPVRRLRLRLRPLGNGAWRRHSHRTDHPASAWSALISTSYSNNKLY